MNDFQRDILNTKTPEDVFNFMNKYIEYGWIDINGEKHIKTMKDFRKLYRTMSIDEIIKYRLGTCIEQVWFMHCFVLYYFNNKVYHMEHPNFERKGIYEYQNEKDALDSIVNYYIELRGGKESPTKEFFEVKPGLTFKEFNKYINNI